MEKRSFADKCPKIAQQWHPIKNGPIKASDISYGSRRKVWWFCERCQYEWPATPNDRKESDGRCPVETGRVVKVGINDLVTKNPGLAKTWHPTKNQNLKPEEVSIGMAISVWWLCPDIECGYEWEATVKSRSRKSGESCPVKSGKIVKRGVNDLATLRPDIALQWHSTKNGSLSPKEVSLGYRTEIWWQHTDADKGEQHEWHAQISERTRKIPRWCAVCDGRQVQIGINDLATLRPDIASQWDQTKNRPLTAQEVTIGCGLLIWWQHTDTKTNQIHEWQASVDTRVNMDSGCSICSGHQIQVGVNDLATTNPEVANEWHPVLNGGLTPKMVTYGASLKVWWRHTNVETNQIHEWPAWIKDRTGKLSNCPDCTKHGFNPAEQAHLYILQTTFGKKNQIVLQFGISNKVKNRLREHRQSGFTSEPLALLYFPIGAKARLLEVSLLALMKEHTTPSCFERGIKFDGSTEAFCLEDADEDFLEEFMELLS